MLQDTYFVAEIIGVVALIASLVFVGIQIRQNTDATKASNSQAAQNGWNSLSMTLATNKTLRKTMIEGTPDPLRLQGLSDDVVSLNYYMNAGMKFMENNYLQWLEGNLSDDVWQSFRQTILHMLASNDHWHDYWTHTRFSHSAKYQKLIDALIIEAKNTRETLIESAKQQK